MHFDQIDGFTGSLGRSSLTFEHSLPTIGVCLCRKSIAVRSLMKGVTDCDEDVRSQG
jgi:hypothetical protein